MRQAIGLVLEAVAWMVNREAVFARRRRAEAGSPAPRFALLIGMHYFVGKEFQAASFVRAVFAAAEENVLAGGERARFHIARKMVRFGIRVDADARCIHAKAASECLLKIHR